MKRLQLNNEEKSRVLAVKAKRKLLASAANDWIKAEEAASEAVKLELAALNRMRTCGIKLVEAAGREQPNFQFFQNCNGNLPKTLTFKALKFCVHLSHSFEKPIETIDEARSARQMLFEAFGYSEAPKRLELQSAHEDNPWNDFVSVSSSFTSLFPKIRVESMQEWRKEELSTFVRQTDPIVEANQKARALL